MISLLIALANVCLCLAAAAKLSDNKTLNDALAKIEATLRVKILDGPNSYTIIVIVAGLSAVALLF